mmetsp:Transcript_28630/g.68274  ORF Transcript_28630/g.68274 Transcript_28630/m.68274 type:complete len:226 (-) Transcript_28630:397-1074(-)
MGATLGTGSAARHQGSTEAAARSAQALVMPEPWAGPRVPRSHARTGDSHRPAWPGLAASPVPGAARPRGRCSSAAALPPPAGPLQGALAPSRSAQTQCYLGAARAPCAQRRCCAAQWRRRRQTAATRGGGGGIGGWHALQCVLGPLGLPTPGSTSQESREDLSLPRKLAWAQRCLREREATRQAASLAGGSLPPSQEAMPCRWQSPAAGLAGSNVADEGPRRSPA